MRYFIIGFKNSGKTTFGRKLAEMTSLAFVDLDEFIEQLEGRSVADLYTRLGDEGFRRIEWKALRKAVRTDNLVIATGGGAPCHCENMNLMEQHGKVIYLKVSDETLVSRLKTAALDRPIVKGKTEEELRQYVSALRDRCEHNYLRASYIIDGDNLTSTEVAAMLKALQA